jgi:hypothetical protein
MCYVTYVHGLTASNNNHSTVAIPKSVANKTRPEPAPLINPLFGGFVSVGGAPPEALLPPPGAVALAGPGFA